MLSDVTIVRKQGLGKVAVRQDGIAGIVADGVALTGKVALETPFVVTSLSEAESLGITEQYDKTNKLLLWHHISDFYAEAPRGTALYVILVAKQTEMVDSLDVTNGAAKKLLTYAKGAVKLLAVTSMSDDWDASGDKVSAAQALYVWAAARNKAVQILLEGRNFAYDTRLDLRKLTGNRVSVVIGHDAVVAAEDAAYANYAAAARFMGRLAAIPVSRDAGRVRTGAVNIATVGLSDGKKATDPDYFDDDQLSAIDSNGYIFLRSFDGMAGWFWNADYTAAPPTDDCDTIRMGRTLDKAADLARLKALEWLRDDVEIDAATGEIAPEVVRSIQADIETAVLTQMSEEISGVECTINPAQSLWNVDTPLVLDLAVVARGVIVHMKINVYYTNSLSDD